MRAVGCCLVVALVLASCLQPASVSCDGYTCPEGKVCDVAHGGCVFEEQLDCAGHPDLTECSFPGAPAGRCYDGVCLPAGCGNGVVEDGEACDDRNTVGGDGCSADCTSDEMCGTGYVDSSRGETCDEPDGNLVQHDGCSDCQLEEMRWRQVGPPSARRGHAMAYDAARRSVIMFGGQTASSTVDETWEWRGHGWRRLAIANGPSPRIGHAMAYDSARGVVVLFGGAGFGVRNDETWEWNGVAWTRVATPVAPSARKDAAMAYDAARQRIILFGGNTGVGSPGMDLNDTWAYDGTWTKLDVTPAPEARARHAMGYDPGLGIVVLFGGQQTSGLKPADTWTWDGSRWTRVVTATKPAPRSDLAMAFDPVHELLLLTGGGDEAGPTTLSDTWFWNDGNWSALGPMFGASRDHAMAFDGHDVITFGGASGSTALRSDTNVRRFPSGWGPDVFDTFERFGHSVVYDAARGTVLTFGGIDPNAEGDPSSDTWLWRGATWEHVIPAMSPSPRARAAIVYDDERRVVFLHGGMALDLSATNDTWRWDGTTWTPVATGPRRLGHAMAYDPIRKETILFGGSDGTSPATSDETWVFDGATWTLRTPATRPPARAGHAMAFDAARGVIVLAGGVPSTLTTTVPLGDTWTWDGTTWTQSLAQLPPRSELAMCYHAPSKTLFAFGGALPVETGDTTWRWNGMDWSIAPTSSRPPSPRRGASCVYDAARQSVVLVEGLGDLGVTADTWELRFERVTLQRSDERCRLAVDSDGDGHSGCADPDCAGTCVACGDGTCADEIETNDNCPADCMPVPACGDNHCDPPETAITCPGDCA